MSSNPDELLHTNPDETPQLRLLQPHQHTDHQLTRNIDWNRDLVEHSRDLLCVHDLEGRLLSVNPVPAVSSATPSKRSSNSLCKSCWTQNSAISSTATCAKL